MLGSENPVYVERFFRVSDVIRRSIWRDFHAGIWHDLLATDDECFAGGFDDFADVLDRRHQAARRAGAAA